MPWISGKCQTCESKTGQSEDDIAFCKLHHTAVDKGMIGIDDEDRVCIADVFVARPEGGCSCITARW